MITKKVCVNEVESAEIARVWKEIQQKGYAVTSDKTIGLSPTLHQYINARFFTEEILGPELPGLPPHDRLRARDVLEYKRISGKLELKEYPTITLRPVASIAQPREYKRTYTLDEPEFFDWIRTLLSMVPPDERQDHGTVGLEFFRTFHDVVAYKHQDNEQFICIYVNARETDGAITSLYPVERPEEAVVSVAIQPGEYLIFRDRNFLHDATPLRPRYPGDKHHRDIIAATIQYQTTYLTPNKEI